MSLLKQLTLHKINWGAMIINPDLAASMNLDGIDGPVMHLGMGSEEDDVQPPQQGHWYI